MPEHVYLILNEQAEKRNLTSFIVELVEQRDRHNEIIEKLNRIEATVAAGRYISPLPVAESSPVEVAGELKDVRITAAKEVTSTVKIDDEDYDF